METFTLKKIIISCLNRNRTLHVKQPDVASGVRRPARNETPEQPTKFSMDENFGDFIVHWSIAALKFFKENLMTNFGLIAVFVKLTFEITKRALSIAFHPD